jgi:hypothetical protein
MHDAERPLERLAPWTFHSLAKMLASSIEDVLLSLKAQMTSPLLTLEGAPASQGSSQQARACVTLGLLPSKGHRYGIIPMPTPMTW